MISNLPIADQLATVLGSHLFDQTMSKQRRLYEAIKHLINHQDLPAGSQLPSSRQLASDLSMSRNTVMSAYEQLIEDGFLSSLTGSGTFVRGRQQRLIPEPKVMQQDEPHLPLSLSKRGLNLTRLSQGSLHEIQPFAPGAPDFSAFPLKLWQRLQNNIWRELQPQLLDYGQSGGYFPLRQAITEYLRLSRGVNVDVDQVMITGGTQQSLDLCAQLLTDANDTVWVENPAYWGARCVLEACDLVLTPIDVDQDGMVIPTKPKKTPKLIYVTPARQFPTGAVMSLSRRKALLEFAHRHQSWILEDDYDSEFRYGSSPLGSLHSLDHYDRVVYMGTFSKVMFPGIKVGYLVVPKDLATPFKTALYDLHRPGQLVVQATLSDFIALGHFTTHLRKIRQIYGDRRALLCQVLAQELGPRLGERYIISKEESGLHLVIELPEACDDEHLSKLAMESGISVKPLSRYYLTHARRKGLIVGYAYVPQEKIKFYGKILAKLIASV